MAQTCTPLEFLDLDFAGQTLRLLPQRAVWWAAASALLVADLHLGKAECLRTAGAAIPTGTTDEHLLRLSALVDRFHATRLIVLGDLLHGPAGLTDRLVDRVAQWRCEADVALEIVPGNHDRRIERVVDPWRMRVLDDAHTELGIVLRHHPPHQQFRDGLPFDVDQHPGSAVIAGHLHPCVSLAGGGDALRLPCFLLRSAASDGTPAPGRLRSLVLPAFTTFASGVSVRTRPGDRPIAIADGMLVDLGGLSPPAPAGRGPSGSR